MGKGQNALLAHFVVLCRVGGGKVPKSALSKIHFLVKKVQRKSIFDQKVCQK